MNETQRTKLVEQVVDLMAKTNLTLYEGVETCLILAATIGLRREAGLSRDQLEDLFSQILEIKLREDGHSPRRED